MISSLIVREYSARTLPREFLSGWEELENRSLEGNAFLSHHFVLPALRHLPTEVDKNPIVLAVESAHGGELLGLGIFEACPGTRLLPLRHLRSWKSTHTFLDGILLDRDRAEEAAVALFQWLRQQGSRWHGIAFQDRSTGSELSAVLEKSASRCGISWQEDGWTERASVLTSRVPDDCVKELYSKRRSKDLSRRFRILEAFGDVRFELNHCETGHQTPLETLLRMEAMGWRGERKEALQSHPGHERFAREMVAGLSAVGQVLFCELSVDGEPVSSALFLRSGKTLFAFKSGWDPQFARCSPGVLTKVRLMESLKGLDGIEMADGCAVPGSWLETYWPWRRRLTTGVLPTTSAGSLAVNATLRLKRVKRWVQGVS
ncbi:MAG: GNAT family N-acetyltransferase [Gemmatimonadales bacterium]|nr:MAG: GNAT family N-acetyltransferase [Gemmatimonadales bacterium]